MRPDTLLLIADHIGLDDPDLDAFMDRFERWRDPSHVRAYTLAEWSSMLTSVGLAIELASSAWVSHMNLPPGQPACACQMPNVPIWNAGSWKRLRPTVHSLTLLMPMAG